MTHHSTAAACDYRGLVDDDLQRRFAEAIAGADLDDLRDITARLLKAGSLAPPPRPDLRRPPRAQTATYRIRVDLDGARPPIWRRLDIRSDVTLDVVHRVLQAAFAWWDYHLHRFSIGGRPFDRESQFFLCPFDADEGEDEGMPASDVRIDEVMQEAGDKLHYVYDYGDGWELTLRLEKVLPREPSAPIAICVGGRNAAPPEDSRGTDLAELLDDPSAFSIDDINAALNDPFFDPGAGDLAPDLVDLVNRLSVTSYGDDLLARMLTVASDARDGPSEDERRAALVPVQWFLDRAHGGGIELTAAGYLRPADVVEAAALLPTVWQGIGKNNRENHTFQLLEFREDLQRLGLLRKYKGRLLLTKAGDAARGDLEVLWRHLASRLIPGERDAFGRASGLLVLLHAASAPGEVVPIDRIAAALTAVGWRLGDGSPLRGHDLWHTAGNVFAMLDNIGGEVERSWRHARPVSTVASALARDALRST